MYLISCKRYEDANFIAKERDFKQIEWRFIPWEPDSLRSEKLAGYRRILEKNLIGYFSDDERYRLVRE